MTQMPARVDLTNCDREPIHIPGAVQPIGFLVALTQDWIVARVSANAEQFLNTAPEAMIGRPASDFFSAEARHAMRNRLAILRGPDAVERMFGCTLIDGSHPFDVAIHMSGSNIVIEAEPRLDQEHADASNTVRSMIARLDQSSDLTSFSARVRGR